MNYRPSKISRVTLDADRIIGDGGTIVVFSILVANNTDCAASVEFQNIAGTAAFTITAAARDSFELEIEFVADGGLQIDSLSDANVIVSVFHSSVGA